MLVKDKEEGGTHSASSRAARGLQNRPDRSILGCPGAGAGAGVGGGLDTTSGARDEATVRAGGGSVRVPRPPAGFAGRRCWGLRATDDEEEKVDAAAGATIVCTARRSPPMEERKREVVVFLVRAGNGEGIANYRGDKVGVLLCG